MMDNSYRRRRTEKVACWFFRLNGCLTIPNFIVHGERRDSVQRPGQQTDVDVLAVRLPYRGERLGSDKTLVDHEHFISNGKIDGIIAEVKSGPCEINGPWVRRGQKIMEYVLYALGAFPEHCVRGVAAGLHENKCYSDKQFRVRIFALGKERNSKLEGTDIVQMTWEEILTFIYRRFKHNEELKMDHDQWDEVGKLLFDNADECTSSEEFVKRILNYMWVSTS